MTPPRRLDRYAPALVALLTLAGCGVGMLVGGLLLPH